VILAAGESTRLGQCKALVPLTPRTPLELLCAAGACFADAPPLVITGADHDEIAAAAPPGAEIGFNPDWRAGRSGGVLLAGRLRPGRDLCIAPVDVPLVPAAVFEALLATWLDADSPDRGWLAPSHTPRSNHLGVPGPRFGHPIVIGRKLLMDLAEGSPATPLHVLRERAMPLFSVGVDHPEILDDLDTPEDFQRLRIRSRG
jgi:CTP:molybdopterin cytidylyltransferase MocA